MIQLLNDMNGIDMGNNRTALAYGHICGHAKKIVNKRLIVNYTVVLQDNSGIAYDVLAQGTHYNFTIHQGLVSDVLVIDDATCMHTQATTGQSADLCQLLLA